MYNNFYIILHPYSALQKIFPNLVKLDGEILPPKISFDVSESSELPPAQASFLCDAAGGDIVRQFLQQYFMLYDSDNRQPLLDAYHEHAMLSLTTHSQKTNDYTKHSRNLYRIRDSEARCRNLKRGRLPIVSFLSELPKTRHDPMSFAVDLSICMPQMMLLTVSGIYEERESTGRVKPYRHFNRVLLIVPSGGGFCIKNEEIVITNATTAEEKAAFSTPSPALNPNSHNTVTTQPQNMPPHPSMAITPASTISDHTKHQMIQAMTTQSKMNLQWSEKCLVETNWNFDRAMFVFSELQKQGNVPAEAFI